MQILLHKADKKVFSLQINHDTFMNETNVYNTRENCQKMS